MTNKNVPTIEFNDDILRLKYLRYRDLVAQKNDIDREIATLKGEFQRVMGTNHSATIDGEEVFTYAPINRFAAGDFAKEHPVLAKEFTRPVVTDELDVEALKAAHPALFEQYRVRQFNTKKV